MEKKSWRPNHGEAIMEENHRGVVMEEKSWRRNHGGEIVEEQSWTRNHGE